MITEQGIEAFYREIERYCVAFVPRSTVETTIRDAIVSYEENKWVKVEDAQKSHQKYMLGYSNDLGTFSCHWRDDKNAWCFTWDQEPCSSITHVCNELAPPKV